MFPGGAFWSPFNICKSNVEELLNKENLILEDILDDENILSDLKSNNEKFGKYLHRHPHFVKCLVDYIIVEPKDDESDFKVCYKYPFVSSEILGCEILGLIKAFFEDAQDADSHMSMSKNFDQISQESGTKDGEKEGEGDKHEEIKEGKKEALLKEEMAHLSIDKPEMIGLELLDHLLGFLDHKEKYLNQTLAGYFQKALNAILNKRGFDMLNYLFEKFDTIKQMIYHSVNKSIIDLILRILCIDIPFIDAKMTLFLEQRKEIMSLLLETFDKTDDYEEAENISFLFCDLISKYKNANAGRELIESLNSAKTLNILFNKLFCKNASIICSSCSIIINLISFFMNKEVEPSSLNESSKSPIKEVKPPTVISIEPEYQNFFYIIESQIQLLMQALNVDNLIPNFNSTFGQEVKPFGAYRLRILEIVGMLIKINQPFKFVKIFCDYKIFASIMDISIKYEFNSFLHALCERIIIVAIETENEEIIKCIIKECDITKVLIKGVLQKEMIISKEDRKVHRGYRAFFIRISNFLIKSAGGNPLLSELLDQDEAWKQFVAGELDAINRLQSKDLGDHNPKKAVQPEEDDNYKIEIDIKKIYEKFSQYFQNGPVKEKKDDFDNELDEDYEKESPEYGSPEKKREEDDEIPEIIESEKKDPPVHKPDNTIKESRDYMSSTFWSTPEFYKIEDLLKEL